ncbi:hypothetical protein A6R68_13772 [Neotoma lepida]|uniref:BHLH domain-containing protein n=1 Tax=Neotoma lepida TaxID=56216 RepID=A0A1A6H1F0_NEOLE|nr:hypothetical protein A6R68_13772 [Neotoma lepida]
MSQEVTGVPAMPRAGLGQTKAKARLLLGTDRKRSRLSRTRQDLWGDTSWSNQRLSRTTSAPRGTRAKRTAHGRAALPAVPPDTKLSKLDVLVLATSYIAHLTRTLGHELPGPAWPPFLRGLRYLHPLKKWPMRSRLYAGGLGCSGLDSTTATAASQRTRDKEVGSQVSVAKDVLLLGNPASSHSKKTGITLLTQISLSQILGNGLMKMMFIVASWNLALPRHVLECQHLVKGTSRFAASLLTLRGGPAVLTWNGTTLDLYKGEPFSGILSYLGPDPNKTTPLNPFLADTCSEDQTCQTSVPLVHSKADRTIAFHPLKQDLPYPKEVHCHQVVVLHTGDPPPTKTYSGRLVPSTPESILLLSLPTSSTLSAGSSQSGLRPQVPTAVNVTSEEEQ